MINDKPTPTNTRIAHGRAYRRATEHFLKAMKEQNALELSIAAQELAHARYHIQCDQVRDSVDRGYLSVAKTVANVLFQGRIIEDKESPKKDLQKVDLPQALEAAMKSTEKRMKKGG